jgi:integrase
MSVEKVVRKSGETVHRVRWRQGGRNRARTFSTQRDALDFEAERRRAARAGTLAQLDAGTESLDEYVTGSWAPGHGVTLAPGTQREYGRLYDKHVSPRHGQDPIRDLTADEIRFLQADLFRAGLGHETVRKAIHVVLGGILTRAVEAGRIPSNPVRLVRMPRRPPREEVRPFAPQTVEQIRRHLLARPLPRGGRDSSRNLRDATVVSVLAYSGYRPGELRRFRWTHIGESTLIVPAGKTERGRNVRLLAPLAADLRTWRLATGRPDDGQYVFPGEDGEEWSANGFNKWRERTWLPALDALGQDPARPYDLRHSFASLLLHEGRSVVYVARQLGHGTGLTASTYGHVIEELEDAPRIDAEAAIRAAREADVPASYPRAVNN